MRNNSYIDTYLINTNSRYQKRVESLLFFWGGGEALCILKENNLSGIREK